MSQEQTKRQGGGGGDDDEAGDAAAAGQERREKLGEDVDTILDEIDDVLEENAEDFVRAYVQKGNTAEAKKTFTEVVDKHPDSPYLAEARTELGTGTRYAAAITISTIAMRRKVLHARSGKARAENRIRDDLSPRLPASRPRDGAR